MTLKNKYRYIFHNIIVIFLFLFLKLKHYLHLILFILFKIPNSYTLYSKLFNPNISTNIFLSVLSAPLSSLAQNLANGSARCFRLRCVCLPVLHSLNAHLPRFHCAFTATHAHTSAHTRTHSLGDFSVAVDAILCISMMRLFDFGIILAKPRSAFHAYKLLNYLSSDNDSPRRWLAAGGKAEGKAALGRRRREGAAISTKLSWPVSPDGQHAGGHREDAGGLGEFCRMRSLRPGHVCVCGVCAGRVQ